jgi:hypothetical protein
MHVSGVPSFGVLVRFALVGVALALTVRAAPALGQNLPPWSTKVKVVVNTEDPLSNRVSSWFTEELRRMQGVEVVDSAPEWEVNLVVLQTKSQGGVVTGFALSEVVLSRYDEPRLFRKLAATDTVRSNRDVWSLVTAIVRVQRRYEDHLLAVGSLDDLRGTIENLAAGFDTKQLEPSRKLWEETGRSVRRP